MFSTNLGAIGADLSKNNASGFSGLPSGFRNANGTFNGMSVKSAWWSNSSSPTVGYAWYMGLFNYYNSAVWGANDDICGLSVRCVKDVK